jgi:alkylhydroperoxidase family enzyme
MTDDDLPDLPAESVELLERAVPPPNRPPLLYLAMAANPGVLRAYVDQPILGLRGLMHTGQIDPAERELCVLRVTANHGAEHEWGVHVAYFGRRSGLPASQVEATVTGQTPDPDWTPRQRAILAVSDAVSAVRPLTDAETDLVERELGVADRTEFTALASLYLGIAALCQVFGIPAEPGAPRMPVRPG